METLEAPVFHLVQRTCKGDVQENRGAILMQNGSLLDGGPIWKHEVETQR